VVAAKAVLAVRLRHKIVRTIIDAEADAYLFFGFDMGLDTPSCGEVILSLLNINKYY
jgi:hypothetical protein